MALVLPFSHCGFSFVWPWRVHTGRNHISLHESTPERQSLFESHRQRRWLTQWSYELAIDRVAVFVKPAELSKDLRRSLERLNRLRNQVEHYALEADKEELVRLLS